MSRATARFPIEERFGLAAQLRRSATSIGANIAEGCGYLGRRDSARFFQIALGSALESLHHMIVAKELGYLTETQFDELEAELAPTRRMLVRLIQRVRRDSA